MTLFRSKHNNVQHKSMTGVLRSTKQKTGEKRSRSEPYRVFDYQHVPISATTIPCDFTPLHRPCSSPSSAALRRSRGKPQSRHKSRSRGTELRMDELLYIKKELTVIKSQIDELLDSLEHVETQSQEPSGGGAAYSPLHGSASSVDGSSPPLKTDRETQSPQTADSSDENRQHNNDKSDFHYM